MDGVLYLMVGTKHAEHLAISLYTLRDHWKGPIAILVGDDKATEYCERFTQNTELMLVPFDYNAVAKGSGSMYLAKTLMHQLSPFDRTVFLDADTIVCDTIDNIFPNNNEIRITNWLGWKSTGKMMRGRIEKWDKVAKCEVDYMLAEPRPAINTGVIGFSKNSRLIMDAWREMTLRNVSFICDEIAMQLIYPHFNCKVLDSRYNASPVFPEAWRNYELPLDEYVTQWEVTNNGKGTRVVSDEWFARLRSWHDSRKDKQAVHVIHGHGNKFIKKVPGRAIWWPIYQRAIADNFCGIADWTPYNRGRRRTRCKLVAYLDNPERWP